MTYSQAALDRAKLLRANEKMPGATQSALDFALSEFSKTNAIMSGRPAMFWREVIKILSETKHEAN